MPTADSRRHRASAGQDAHQTWPGLLEQPPAGERPPLLGTGPDHVAVPLPSKATLGRRLGITQSNGDRLVPTDHSTGRTQPPTRKEQETGQAQTNLMTRGPRTQAAWFHCAQGLTWQPHSGAAGRRGDGDNARKAREQQGQLGQEAGSAGGPSPGPGASGSHTGQCDRGTQGA